MIIPTGAADQRMTTAKRQTLGDFMYYSLCEGQTKAGPYGYSPLPLNLVQAGLRADRQAEDGGPGRRPHRPRRHQVQQPDVRRQEPVEEPARRDRAAAGRLRQGGRGPVRHRDRHRRAVDRRRRGGAGRHRRDAGRPRRRQDRRRHPRGAGWRRRPRSTRTPARWSRRPARRPAARPRTSQRRPSWPPAGPPTPRPSAGWPPLLLVALVLLPGLMVSSFRRRPPAGSAMSAPTSRLRSRRPLAVSGVALLLAGLVAAFAPAPAAPVRRVGATASSTTSPVAPRRRTRATKPLTRVFENADGTTYEFPTNTVTVNASETKNLRGRQRITISWTGAQPSGGRASNPYGENGLQQEYPVVILQCRGLDDASLPRREAAASGDLLDRLGRPAVADHPLRRRGDLDPRPARGGRRQGAGLRDDAVPDRGDLPHRGPGPVLHPG